ncbi:hypothetical protein ACFSM5_06605 [Lacibacterium aquatile]|uniref:Uncharacterized protein n=1 Tax=Lacibacterium aquatile TaxID=1168082 RepID=A0ABW5DN64_9PROT
MTRAGVVGFLVAMLSASTAGALERSASWTSDFGPLSMKTDKLDVLTGSYSKYQGQLIGKITGDRIQATWVQPQSEKRCARAQYGSNFWGTVQWKLQPNGSLAGTWAYCDDRAGSGGAWNGNLTAGSFPMASAAPAAAAPQATKAPAAPAPAGKASPVVAGDVFAQFKAEIGFPDKLKEAQQLKGDFTCDGVEDRAVGYLDRYDPKKPEYVIMLVTHHAGNHSGQTVRFPLSGDDEKNGQMCGDGKENDISIEIEKYTAAKAKAFTGADVCNVTIRSDDQICAPFRLFWKTQGKENDRLLVTRKVMQ